MFKNKLLLVSSLLLAMNITVAQAVEKALMRKLLKWW
jgi:L-cystine transport system substrate-binding protein